MRITVPSTPTNYAAVRAGRLRTDAILIPQFLPRNIDECRAVLPDIPLMLHLSIVLSGDDIEAESALIAELVRRTGCGWTSAHIGFNCTEVAYNEARDRLVVAGRPLTRAEALTRIADNARRLQDRVGVPLLLENQATVTEGYIQEPCRDMVEPEFLAEAIERSGCDLLLDLAHARVSAEYLGTDIDFYLSDLPLEKVREIHISGARPVDGRLSDMHRPLSDIDYDLLANVLPRTGCRMVTLEFIGSEADTTAQVDRLRGACARAL